MRRLSACLLSALLCLSALLPSTAAADDPCSQGTAFRNCRACGRAKRTPRNPQGTISDRTKRQNVLKNRDDAPATIDSAISLEKILELGNDKDRWDSSKGVTITGFVAEVGPGGYQESCNCGRADLQDIHIDVVLDPSDTAKIKRMVVEITPRWKSRLGLTLGNARSRLKGKWVRFSGWLFFDQIHSGQAENTAPGRRGNWRATAWEVHPVTAFEILPGRP